MGRPIRSLIPLAASLTLLFLFSPLASGDDKAPQIPPRKEWIDVVSVQAEYTYVSAQRSDDGGSYEVQRQCTGVVDGVHFDQLICKCSATGKARVFTFDITHIVKARAFAASKQASTQAFALLDRRYPMIDETSVSILNKLLQDKNPGFRVWSIGRLAEIASPASDKVLLAAYDQADLLQEGNFLPALVARGDAIVPLVRQHLQAAKPEVPWHMVGLLQEIHTATSARVLEVELKHARKELPDSTRPCYIAIGKVGNRGSQQVLLEALQRRI